MELLNLYQSLLRLVEAPQNSKPLLSVKDPLNGHLVETVLKVKYLQYKFYLKTIKLTKFLKTIKFNG